MYKVQHVCIVSICLYMYLSIPLSIHVSIYYEYYKMQSFKHFFFACFKCFSLDQFKTDFKISS